MAVQHIFISINESAPIRNFTLFSIVAVDSHNLCRLLKVRECLLSESTFLYRGHITVHTSFASLFVCNQVLGPCKFMAFLEIFPSLQTLCNLKSINSRYLID